MFCPRCNERISESWTFCPRCGAKLPQSGGGTEDEFDSSFGEIFRDIKEQMKDALGNDLSGDIEFFDLKPEFIKKHPLFRSGGFRVKITRAGDGPPDVDIKAFGDIDEETAKKMEEAIQEQRSRMRSSTKGEGKGKAPKGEKAETRYRHVSEYTEPSCETKWAQDHLVVELDLPRVESSKDIDVKKLSESIEIRAFAGNKGYFKILSIPKDAELISKRFRNQKLTLKIA